MGGGLVSGLVLLGSVVVIYKGYQSSERLITLLDRHLPVPKGPNDVIEMYRDGMVDGCAGNKPGEYGYGVVGIPVYEYNIHNGRKARDEMRKAQRARTNAQFIRTESKSHD